MPCLTSKDRDLIRIPRTVAQPFMCEFRFFNRIDPATAMLGSHSGAISFRVVVAHVIRKAYKIGALSSHSRNSFSKSKFTISSFVLAFNMEGCFLLQIPLICDVISWRTFSTTTFLSLTFFSALAMRCSKPEAIAYPRTARSSFNSFRTVLLGYSTGRYTFVSVIDRSEISRGVFGVEDDIGHNCIGPTIPDDCTQFGARKIESGAIGLMEPKPKTGGSFVKADTQTLSGGFKLTGNGGPREISPEGLESKLKRLSQ